MTDPTPRRPTMRDVADRAGVSFKSVSRVVNREPGVRPELVARIEAAIDELRYRPDERARRLRQDGLATGTIGAVLADIANPFLSAAVRGIEDVARQHETLLLAASTDADPEREDQVVSAFAARRVDGLIVIPFGPIRGSLEIELERGTPVVFLDHEPGQLRSDLVRGDHRGGAVKATEHLLSHGHRDIAFFGDDPEVFSARLRFEGYRQAIEAAGLAVDDRRVVHAGHDDGAWRRIIRSALDRPDRPTALFTAQNLVTLGAVGALHDLGLQQTIAMVGFDDVALADTVQPGITTVPQHPRELGRRAATQLFDRIAGSTDPIVEWIAPAEVVPRGSGEIPPADG